MAWPTVPYHIRRAGLMSLPLMPSLEHLVQVADRRTPLEEPLHNKMALLLALVKRSYIRKNSITSRGGRI